jgi:hypothetical protein
MTLYQLRRRSALALSGSLSEKDTRGLSIASGASARSVVRTAPRKGTRAHSTVQVLSADRFLRRTAYLLRCSAYYSGFVWRCKMPPFLPMADTAQCTVLGATGFLAGIR